MFSPDSPILNGMIMGFLVAAPVGPVCVLCIQRSIAHGYRMGVSTGFGSSIALAIYGFVAAYGVLTAMSQLPMGFHILFSLLGALILSYLGWKIFQSVPVVFNSDSSPSLSHAKAILSTFILEILSPAVIMINLGIIVSLRMPSFTHTHEFLQLGLGVFLSSMLWWICLAVFVSSFRKYFNRSRMVWLNRLSGLFIIYLGIAPLFQAIWDYL